MHDQHNTSTSQLSVNDIQSHDRFTSIDHDVNDSSSMQIWWRKHCMEKFIENIEENHDKEIEEVSRTSVKKSQQHYMISCHVCNLLIFVFCCYFVMIHSILCILLLN
jgi:hypothetical protein